MSVERIQGSLTIFRQACELPAEERAAFLDRACGGDAELRAEVESMLAWDEDDAEHDEAPHPVRAALSDLADQARAEKTETPESIGGYRIVRLLAHGGMGMVYEARQENPARRVALKVSRAGGTTGERAKRFELEAQLLARLRHPSIAQIIEAGTTGPEQGALPFFVMEYVDGQPLTEYADAHLAAARGRLELMASVCEAVACAHAQGVVHRDLKPDNVLIEPGGAPKVLDFGVAKVQEAGGFGAATLRTEAGRVLGTMGYMAPEQLAGRTEGLGPAADVYSLGVMLYELLTGRLPHDLTAATITHALAIVTSTDAPLLGVVRPEYRGDIEAVVAKALEKDPRHRYPDAGALKADLERHLRGEPTLARPAGPLLKLTKWTRRNPALATAVFGLFLALSIVAAALLVMNREARAALQEKARLLDAKDARLVAADADELWPARLETVPAIREWLDRYRQLLGRLPEHRDYLQSLRDRSGRLDGGAWTFDDDLLQREHDDIEQMIRELEALEDDSLLERMEARVELALSIERITVTDRAAEWRAAVDRIRANPRYRGLALEPQVGLIPLGPDPDSGLEEFLHYETHAGAIPPAGNGAKGTLAFDGSVPRSGTGIVFVLIPGGTFCMGAQKEDPDGRNHDPLVTIFETPEHDVPVKPFLISKYEMTQGQWERFTGKNPSRFKSPVEPVTTVSWTDCNATMRRLGLVLPHEEQWEYAARGGEGDKPIWWTGNEVTSLAGKENVYDETTAEWDPMWRRTSGEEPGPWKDEKKQRRFDERDHGPAPVGTYAANDFGLYDIGGNVTEWCSNAPYQYPDVPADEPGRMCRGGNHRRSPVWARSTARLPQPVASKRGELGLRPAMAIRR